MRRGFRGRGYSGGGPSLRPLMNIPRQLQPPQPHEHSGNFTPDHMQGLKDIDMELELLKRKREIIEQQQQILTNSYNRRNDYEQSFNQSRESRYDFTGLYDEPRDQQYSRGFGGGRGGSTQSRKRTHTIPVWENEAPPKRFSGPSQGAKSFGSRLGPPPNPRPSYRAPQPTPKQPRRPPIPPQKKKEFNPTKVTKPSIAPPIKLASYQPQERKKLVTEASATVRGGAGPAVTVDWVLRADVEPNHKMVGRLELGLGVVMRNLKLAHPEHQNLFKAPVSMRAMKKVVRERIRVAMIGKPVTTPENITAIYYDMFPTTFDEQVVMAGIEAHTKKFVVTDTANAENYFKKNILKLMSLKMDEMINKLTSIYGEGALMPEIEQPLYPSVIPKPNPNIKVIYKTNNVNKETEPGENIGVKNTDNTQNKPNDPNTKVDETVAVEEQVNINTPTETAVNKALIDSDHAKIIDTPAYLALDKLMTHKILHLLKKYAPEFLKVMDANKMYRDVKAAITDETRSKILKGSGAAGQPSEDVIRPLLVRTPEKITPPRPPRLPLLYFVKILGRPSLPKRKAMEFFFKKFSPQTIKKHKSIHNLLFVGFNDKESYEKILAADGTVIGRFTLDIKISERNTDSKKNQSKTDDSLITINKTEDNKLDESTENIIGADLDNQITDLLSSIRQSEESFDIDQDIVMAEAPALSDNVEKNDTEIPKIDEDIHVKPEANDDDVVEVDDVPQDKNDGEIIEENNEDIDDVPQDENGDDVVEITDVPQDKNDEDINVAPVPKEIKDDAAKAENGDTNKEVETILINEEEEKMNTVSALKNDVKEVKTPTRASARLSAPSSIRTRRMSKLIE